MGYVRIPIRVSPMYHFNLVIHQILNMDKTIHGEHSNEHSNENLNIPLIIHVVIYYRGHLTTVFRIQNMQR